ncbi:MAG: radical SAM family heme chaperone HemW [Selenomonadaceae bacterium]|nr:radical SAM family heme chaperone HemW [Selenomonadaceae bacterium]
MKTNWGVYVHIPFCKRKCDYCDFVSFVNNGDTVTEYIKALALEINYRMPKTIEKYGKPATLYIGGGTPSLLAIKEIDKIFSVMGKYTNIADFEEITIEANPESVTREKLTFYKNLGVNRVSFGAQSFNDNILKRIGRLHTAKEAVNAVTLAKEVGFDNVSLDLMYALPGEALTDLQSNIETAAKLEPEHISAYCLTLEEGTPLYKKCNAGEVVLPTEESESAMYDLAVTMLPKLGFQRYEISNFAKQGKHSRHNMLYWTDATYLGVGLSAASYIENERFKNVNDLTEYIVNPIMSRIKEERNASDGEFEYIFLALRTVKGLNKNHYATKYGVEFKKRYKKSLAKLTSARLMIEDDEYFRLTERGFKVSNEVFGEFIGANE